MYIQEIIMDGFKSYATRTVISGFDQSFNAITGLNGTGKSNIFDAICFGLGCSDWKKLRVQTQEELIYKSGQAGVTKASVTLVFNNSDKEKSPIGYADYATITVTRTIAIGGRNKFLINGQTADQKRVTNLYRSVQLNINNPHFVILQGTITKVLNMKPTEILSMIEEAAGTKLFEDKKNEALKTIEKKEQKLKEIENMLKEEITPTLEKLEKQREGFLTWSNMTTECETLARFCTAYQFYEKEKLFLNGDDLMKQTKQEISEAREVVESAAEKMQDIDKKLEKLKKKKNDNHEFKDLEKKVSEISKTLVKQNSVWQGKKDEYASEKESLASVQDGIQDVKASIAKLTSNEKKTVEDYEKIKSEHDSLSQMLNNLTNQLHSLQAGIASSGSGKTLTEQLIEFKKIASNAATQAQQCVLKISHMTKELAEKKKLVAKSDSETENLVKKQQALQLELKKMQQDMNVIPYDEIKYQEKVREKESLVKQIRDVKDEIHSLQSKCGKFEFSHKKDKNLDGKVKGRVANLFEIKDGKNATALEVTAGGKLYNVVVEDEKTAQKLIESGTNERITVIPLTKIHYETISDRIVEKSQEVSKGSSDLALNLVDYNSEVKKAMEYVFGQTIICPDTEVAEKVAFHKDVKKKTVSLKGDMFDPSGTLTGGSRQNSDALKDFAILKQKKKQLSDLEAKLEAILKQIDDMNKSKTEWKKLKQDFDMKTREVDLMISRMKETKHSVLLEEINQLELEIQQESNNKEKHLQESVEKEASCKQIEKDMKNFSNSKDVQIKQIEREIETIKKKQNKISDEFKNKEILMEKSKAQIESAQAELVDLENQLEAKTALLESLAAEVTRAEKSAQNKKTEYEQIKKELDDKKSTVAENDDRIVELGNEKDAIEKERTESILRIKKLDAKLLRDEKDQKEAREQILVLIKEHPWIKSEKVNFGKPGTDFDFVAKNPIEETKRLSDLVAKQQKLSKTINRKVLSMFDKAQEDYKKLVDKKKIVETDKSKIEQVIKEVDEKKNEAIEKTWKKVNEDFGSIFQTLLPGTKAKLEPVEGSNVMNGLEVRVAFGSVWKESLTELSGGQRSLLALSLILSLLLFKPAPMYILDEVDAALDPSHTQNIGRIVKNHFSSSQFIIISLKEGMFSNANVIFRTAFEKGSSCIKRTVNESPSTLTQQVLINKENEMPLEKEVPVRESEKGRKRKAEK